MGWIHAHIQAQTADTIEMVWTADPAILSDHGPKPVLIPLAEVTTKGQPDVFVLRPLNSAEYIRIMDLCSRGMAATGTIEAAFVGTAEIRPAGSTAITGAQVREILNHHCPADLLAQIGSWVVQASRKGVDDLPFRAGGTPPPDGDSGGTVRSDLRGLSSRQAL